MSYTDLFTLLASRNEKVIYSGTRFVLTDHGKHYYQTNYQVDLNSGRAWAQDLNFAIIN